jgi:hypothetical protein
MQNSPFHSAHSRYHFDRMFGWRQTATFTSQVEPVVLRKVEVEVGGLDISYSSSAVRRICKNRNSAIKELGTSTGQLLHERLSDIAAAESGSDLKLLPGIFTLHDETGAITSSAGAAVVLSAEQGHSTAPRDSHGRIDWAEVLRLKVMSVGGQK